MHLTSITPVLRIFDLDKAMEFYVGYLVFQMDWEHRFEPDLPTYLQVSKGECRLHLSEHFGDASPGTALRIQTTGLQHYHTELSGKQYRYVRPAVERMPWGTLDMAIVDPFGNRLTFTELEEG